MRLSSRIRSLERAGAKERGRCAMCGGIGRVVFESSLRGGLPRGSPCPACGRAITVRLVDMIGSRREDSGAAAGRAA